MPVQLETVREQIEAAAATGRRLRLRGGGTKDFYGEPPQGELLEVNGYRGVIDYEPSELVVTARAGTPLGELEALLAGEGQMLAFEPPHFGAAATVGGCVASGLSGPRRAAAGSLRDHVLGVALVDGRGRLLRFGGRVMKNVAGYDVSRLMAGSLGVLGWIAEVSLKVLPRPRAERALRFDLSQPEALAALVRWAAQPFPISASAWDEGVLRVRLSGAPAAVAQAARALGGESLAEEEAVAYWRALREHELPFFAGDRPLWRIAVPANVPPLALPGPQLVEWDGALRWLRTEAPAAEVRAAAAAAGGHATLFRTSGERREVFAPLTASGARLHAALKEVFDPKRILNPGRLYPGL